MARCPTPWKVAHPDQPAAEKHLNGLRAGKRRFAAFQHVYACACGSWHVGDRRRKPRGKKKPKGAW